VCGVYCELVAGKRPQKKARMMPCEEKLIMYNAIAAPQFLGDVKLMLANWAAQHIAVEMMSSHLPNIR